MMIGDASFAIHRKSETIATAESRIRPLTCRARRAPVLSPSAFECEASI